MPATNSQDAELAAFLSSSRTSAPAVRQAAPPRQQRRKPLTGPIVLAVTFLLVASFFAIWAFNAARAVSQFTHSIGASATADNGVTLARLEQIQLGMSYQQVVQSTFAPKNFLPTKVLSSNYCGGLVNDDENSQAATKDAFEVLHFIASTHNAVLNIWHKSIKGVE